MAGVLLILDEMGKFLEYVAQGGEGDVYFFQQLAEEASRSKGKLLVVGILHQAFDDYAHRLAREVRDEWLKIQGRFADIPLNIAAEEQVELISRAIEVKGRRPVLTRAEQLATALRRGHASGAAWHSAWPSAGRSIPLSRCYSGRFRAAGSARTNEASSAS